MYSDESDDLSSVLWNHMHLTGGVSGWIQEGESKRKCYRGGSARGSYGGAASSFVLKHQNHGYPNAVNTRNFLTIYGIGGVVCACNPIVA